VYGCGNWFSPRFETASTLPEEPRKPDGVAIDRDSYVSDARQIGRASEGLLALVPPIDHTEALRPVRVFFRAVVAEDIRLLSTVLASGAEYVATGNNSRLPMTQVWAKRFDKFDYALYAKDPPYRENTIETYRFEDLTSILPGRPVPPLDMDHNDTLVRVPIARTGYGYDRLFGDEMLFVIRWVGRQPRIQTVYEDYSVQ